MNKVSLVVHQPKLKQEREKKTTTSLEILFVDFYLVILETMDTNNISIEPKQVQSQSSLEEKKANLEPSSIVLKIIIKIFLMLFTEYIYTQTDLYVCVCCYLIFSVFLDEQI